MKLRRTIAAVMSAALLCAGGSIMAVAAEPQDTATAPATPVAGEQTVYPYTIGVEASIVEIMEKSGDYNSVRVKTTGENGQELILNLSAETVLLDTQTGLPVGDTALKTGEKVFVYHDAAMTRSIPAQTHAQAILVNLDKDRAPAHLLTAEQVTVDAEGNVTLLAESGTMLVTIGKDTPISPLYTKNIVRNTDIHMGTRVFAWYDIVALSMPGQAQALKAVILPNLDREFTIVSEGDIAIGSGKVQDGVAMVPIRPVAEKLGFTVSWDAKTESVLLNNGTTKTSVKIGEDSYYKAAAKEGLVGMSKPTSLGAAAYTEKGVSWAPAELFNLLLAAPTLTLQGSTLQM